MIGLKSPVEVAQREVERFHQAELDLSDEYLRLRAEGRRVAADSGRGVLDQFLDGTAPADLRAPSLAEQDARLAALDTAIADARRRRVQAIEATYRAQAADCRTAATGKRREASKRQERTDRLLAELREFEGVAFGVQPFPLDSMTLGAGEAGLLLAAATRRPLSRTEQLQAEAAALEHRASEVERQAVRQAGGVGPVDSLDGLLAAVHGLDPLVIGPSLPSVAAWWAEYVPAVEAQIAAHAPGTADFGGHVAASIVWKAGELDPARSELRAVSPQVDGYRAVPV
jgi:hypothetical protein